jgi:hypothetical protein
MQTPIHDAEAKHKAALPRLATAEHSDLVARAEAAKAKIDSEAMAKSAEKGCKENCRAILETQVNAATAAVETAKSDVQREIAAARVNLAQKPLPGSASPLADRLGWPAWLLDLVIAGLASLSCNGLAMCLLAFAAHYPDTRIKTAPAGIVTAPLLQSVENYAVTEKPRADHVAVAKFMLKCLPRAKGGEVEARTIYERFCQWCETQDIAPLDPKTFATAFMSWCERGNICVRRDGQKFYCIDVKLVA